MTAHKINMLKQSHTHYQATLLHCFNFLRQSKQNSATTLPRACSSTCFLCCKRLRVKQSPTLETPKYQAKKVFGFLIFFVSPYICFWCFLDTEKNFVEWPIVSNSVQKFSLIFFFNISMCCTLFDHKFVNFA